MSGFLENGGDPRRLWAGTLVLYSLASAACWLGREWVNGLGHVPWWLVFILGPPGLLTAGAGAVWIYVLGTMVFVAGASVFWLGVHRDSEQGIWGLLAIILVWVVWGPFWFAGAAV